MNILEYAINMEIDAEKYYTKQAEINRNNSLYVVCSMLAKDENNHARILKNRLGNLPYELTDSDMQLNIKNVFKDIDNFKSEIKKIPSQLDFYRMVLEKEKESIDLYTDFLSKAIDEPEKTLFSYLIKQETKHYEIIYELVLMLRHTEDWVESAEFGIRGEY
ncbi:MAG: ferritin family protein [Eubacteriales bacterium]